MKRWLLYPAAVLLIAAIGWMPFTGTDVAKLQPVELIRISTSGLYTIVETDTGQYGVGENLDEAFTDLKSTTAGQIFLETADHLILGQGMGKLPPQVYDYLRPGCTLCREEGQTDLKAAVAFLRTHEPESTLQNYRAGEVSVPGLITVDGRMYLVS